MTSLGRPFRRSRVPMGARPSSSAVDSRSMDRPAPVTERPGASGAVGAVGRGLISPDQSAAPGTVWAAGGAPLPPL